MWLGSPDSCLGQDTVSHATAWQSKGRNYIPSLISPPQAGRFYLAYHQEVELFGLHRWLLAPVYPGQGGIWRINDLNYLLEEMARYLPDGLALRSQRCLVPFCPSCKSLFGVEWVKSQPVTMQKQGCKAFVWGLGLYSSLQWNIIPSWLTTSSKPAHCGSSLA